MQWLARLLGMTKMRHWPLLATVCLTILAGLTGLFSSLHQGFAFLSYDTVQSWQNRIFGWKTPRQNNVAAVYLDDASRRTLNQAHNRPWDRRLHSRLIRKLSSMGARAIVFDILFDEPGPDPATDEDLAHAIRESGNIVLAADFDFEHRTGGLKLLTEILPLPSFRNNAAGLGFARVRKSQDEVVREIYVQETRATIATNSLAFAAGKLLDLKDNSSSSRLWLNYYGPAAEIIPGLSFYRVLSDDEVPRSFFQDKIVFVGGRSNVGYLADQKDQFRTPLGNGTFASGVEIHALTLLNLLNHDALIQLSPALEFLLIILFGILSGTGFCLTRPFVRLVCGVACILSIGIFALLSVRLMHIWWIWTVPAFLQVPTAMLCWIFCNRVQRFPKQVTATADPDRTTTLSRGDIEIPNYELLPGIIGEGSYGEVHLAKTITGQLRAVKIVRRERFKADRPFIREFEGITHFEPISRSHEGFVDILHVGGDPKVGYFFYVMELADPLSQSYPERYVPKTLRIEIDQRGSLLPDECLNLGLSLSSALSFLHNEGLVHRDIKPSNILFIGGVPKIADIGLVTEAKESGTFVGTEGYIPPSGGGRTQGDLFALGKVLYEALTGSSQTPLLESPENGNAPPSTDLYWRLLNIALRACASDPKDGYSSAAALNRDLRDILVVTEPNISG